MRAPLPLSGEYAVTANQDDRTLTVVPIGMAKVVATVPLDVAPGQVSAAPNSDLALVADAGSQGQTLALAALNSSAIAGKVDSSGGVVSVSAPAASSSGTAVVVTEDDHLRPFDTSTRSLGSPVELDAGPHAISFGRTGGPSVERILVANAGAGTVAVLDEAATTVQRSLPVGGTPVGVAQTVDGRLWVTRADTASVDEVDLQSGSVLSSIPLAVDGLDLDGLTGLSATWDGHFLVLASRSALISVNLWQVGLDRSPSEIVHFLAVPSGVLALSAGAEPGRAYATTGDGSLVYWDLVRNALSETISVGRNPTGLAIGMVAPTGGTSLSASAAGGGGGGTAAGGTTSGTTSPSGSTSSGSAASTAGASAGTSAAGASSAASPSGSTSTSPSSSGASTTGGSTTTSPSGSSASTTTGGGSTPNGSTGPTGSTSSTTPSVSTSFGGASPDSGSAAGGAGSSGASIGGSSTTSSTVGGSSSTLGGTSSSTLGGSSSAAGGSSTLGGGSTTASTGGGSTSSSTTTPGGSTLGGASSGTTGGGTLGSSGGTTSPPGDATLGSSSTTSPGGGTTAPGGSATTPGGGTTGGGATGAIGGTGASTNTNGGSSANGVGGP